MPQLPTQYQTVLKEECVWASADLEVFQQKSQHIKFRYQNCDNGFTFTPSVEDGNFVYLTGETKALPKVVPMKGLVIIIEKLGPLTLRQEIEESLPQAALADGACEITELSTNVLYVHANTEFMENGFAKAFATVERDQAWQRASPCGVFGDWPGWMFTSRDGLFFAVPAIDTGGFVDISSIIYENKG